MTKKSKIKMEARGVTDVRVRTGSMAGQPGQINGFTVVYSQEAVGPADKVQVIHKEWKAPQLGCYPLVQEWVGKAHGLAMDTKQTLASIKLGEPEAVAVAGYPRRIDRRARASSPRL